MARRRAPAPVAPATPDGPPAWLWQYVQAEWEQRSDGTSQLARENKSPEFGRIIHARVRWSAACTAWAKEHGITLKELRAMAP